MCADRTVNVIYKNYTLEAPNGMQFSSMIYHWGGLKKSSTANHAFNRHISVRNNKHCDSDYVQLQQCSCLFCPSPHSDSPNLSCDGSCPGADSPVLSIGSPVTI